MMQPFGQVPAFEEGDLKLFGKKYDSKHIQEIIRYSYIKRKVYLSRVDKLVVKRHGHLRRVTKSNSSKMLLISIYFYFYFFILGAQQMGSTLIS